MALKVVVRALICDDCGGGRFASAVDTAVEIRHHFKDVEGWATLKNMAGERTHDDLCPACAQARGRALKLGGQEARARRSDLLARHEGGETMRQIGASLGLSGGRIGQIIQHARRDKLGAQYRAVRVKIEAVGGVWGEATDEQITAAGLTPHERDMHQEAAESLADQARWEREREEREQKRRDDWARRYGRLPL